MESRSLVSHKSSDSGLHVQLHPLVLLSISDHNTRHAAQQKEGPVVGALLGQHNGREITLEHLFECFVITGPNGEAQLSEDWFGERLKQCKSQANMKWVVEGAGMVMMVWIKLIGGTVKDVHKIPALDIVGWWSTAPSSGPDASHLPIHRQILQNYNESAVFLAFHPSQAPTASSNGSKLPLSVYESVYEGDHAAEGDKAMQVDGEEQSLNIRFRELPYFVETGEMEMIGIDTVARSARNAAAEHTQQEGQSAETKEQDDAKVGDAVALSHEEEEVIASLNTRLNAVRTLESRISLIKSYVATLSDSQETNTASTATLSHPILRNINSLLSHLSLLNPHEQSEFYAETLAQKNDVILVTLLGQLGQSIKGMRDLGRKAAVVSNVRQTAGARKTQAAMHGRFDGGELFTGQDGSTTPGGLFG